MTELARPLSVANIRAVRDAQRAVASGEAEPTPEHSRAVHDVLDAMCDLVEVDVDFGHRSAPAVLLGMPFLMQRALARVGLAAIDQTVEDREKSAAVLDGAAEAVRESSPAVSHLVAMLASVVKSVN